MTRIGTIPQGFVNRVRSWFGNLSFKSANDLIEENARLKAQLTEARGTEKFVSNLNAALSRSLRDAERARDASMLKLIQIIDMETPGANATVKRMAKVARS